MVVLWQDTAKEDLHRIFNFYKYELLTEQTAISIWNDIVDGSKLLSQFPNMGQMESTLSDLVPTYRYILVRNIYKIIYFVLEDTIHIVAIWNCKNNPTFLQEQIVRTQLLN